MESSLLNLVNNIAAGNQKIKSKDCDCFLEYESARNNLVKHKGLCSNKDYSNKIDEELKE